MWRFIAGGGVAICLMAAGFFFWQGHSHRHHQSHARPTTSLIAMAPPPANAEAIEPLYAPEASPMSREQKRFKRYDHDRNGVVSRAEYLLSRQKAFAKLDSNKDGKLSLDEYAAKTSAKFAAADRDKSGGLNQGELAKTAINRSTKAKKRNCPPAKTRDDDGS
jgi:hypothetical protein